MGLLTKLSKELVSKSVRKVGGNVGTIRTTAQTIGSRIPGIAGGKTIAKATARATSKALTGTATIAGKAIVPVGITGGLALGTTKIYDYYQDVRSKTPELRAYDMGLDLAEREMDLLDRAQDVKGHVSKTGSGLDVASDELAVGGTLSDYLPMFGRITDKGDDVKLAESRTTQMKTVAFGIFGVGLLYIANKSGIFKKKK